MAEFVLKNGYLDIGGTVVSDRAKSIVLNLTKEAPDSTTMGADSRTFSAEGLRNATISGELVQDLASSESDAILHAAYENTSAVTFEIRNDSGSVSATNPEYTGSLVITSYTPIGQSVGDLALAPFTAQVTGDVTRGVV